MHPVTSLNRPLSELSGAKSGATCSRTGGWVLEELPEDSERTKASGAQVMWPRSDASLDAAFVDPIGQPSMWSGYPAHAVVLPHRIVHRMSGVRVFAETPGLQPPRLAFPQRSLSRRPKRR